MTIVRGWQHAPVSTLLHSWIWLSRVCGVARSLSLRNSHNLEGRHDRSPIFGDQWSAASILLCTALVTAITVPLGASADTDLVPGSSAVVAYADGDSVRLRIDASYDADIVSFVAEGTTVEPIDGPFEANDGSLWYRVSVNGSEGYIVADYLAASSAIYSSTSGSDVTTDSVNLRSGPSLGESIVTSLESGETVTLTGENLNGWLSVEVSGSSGYIYGAFVTAGGTSSSSPSGSETGTRYADGTLNLRSGPSVSDAVMSVLPSGATIELLGETSDGFVRVTTDAGTGWVASEFLLTNMPQATTETGTRYTDDALNLRTGPSVSESVLVILPMGTEVNVSGAATGDFVEVTTADGSGWVAAEFLKASQPAPESTQASLITWPIEGGTWSVLQGYNGSSHQNRSDLWQYQYSIDLVYEDGQTAGQPVFSPVEGTVRFYDEETGGISIDMGNGYAFAMFHVIFDAGIPEGASVSQGQYLGQIAPAGQAASGSTAHLHITIWETDDGGNWSRRAVPFVGNLALSGVEFPDQGSSFDHTGAIVNP